MTCHLLGEISEQQRLRLVVHVIRDWPEDNEFRRALERCLQTGCFRRFENFKRLRESVPQLNHWAVKLEADRDGMERLRSLAQEAGSGVNDPFGCLIKLSEVRGEVWQTFVALANIIALEGRRPRGGRPTSQEVKDAAARLGLWASPRQLIGNLVAQEMGTVRWLEDREQAAKEARNRVKQRVRRALSYLNRCLRVLHDLDPETHHRWWLIAGMLGNPEPVLRGKVA